MAGRAVDDDVMQRQIEAMVLRLHFHQPRSQQWTDTEIEQAVRIGHRNLVGPPFAFFPRQVGQIQKGNLNRKVVINDLHHFTIDRGERGP